MFTIEKILTVIILTLHSLALSAQFNQVEDTFVMEDSISIQYDYSNIYFSGNSWKICGKNHAIIEKKIGDHSFSYNFRYIDSNPLDPYTFSFLASGPNQLLVASNTKGGKASVSQNGKDFTLLSEEMGSGIVLNQDTLFSLLRIGGISASTAYAVFSSNYGDSWDTIGLIPYNFDNSYLIQTKGGAPLYALMDLGTLELNIYEINTKKIQKISTPVASGNPFIAGNTTNIGAGFVNITSGESSFYFYNRENNNWTNQSSNFDPYNFTLAQVTVSEEGVWTLTGERTLNNQTEKIGYQFNGSTWSTISIPEEVDIYQLLCEEGECMARTSNGIYFSKNNGGSWEKLNLFNTPIHSLKVDGDLLYFSNNKGVYQIQNNLISPLFTYNQALQITSSKLLYNSGVFYLLLTRDNDKNLLYASFDNGVTWETEPLPVSEDFNLQSILGNSLIGFVDGKYYSKTGQNEIWTEISGWGVISDYKAIIHTSGYYVIDGYFGKLNYSPNITTELTDFTPSNPGYSTTVYDAKIKNGILYILTQIKQGAIKETKIYRLDESSNQWQVVFQTDQLFYNIITSNLSGGVYGSTRWQREPQLFEYNNLNLTTIFDQLPPSAIINDWESTSTDVYVATENFGLWKLPKQQLQVQENYELELTSNMFPNPVHSTQPVQFNWEGDNNHAQLHIYNSNGQVVYRKLIGKQEQINHNLPLGVYLTKVENLEFTTLNKLIVID